MKSVGEVMAIGRTFQESLQKALRGLETGLDGLDPQLSAAADRGGRGHSWRYELRAPGAEPAAVRRRRVPRRLDARARRTSSRTSIPWFLAQIEDLMREEAQRAREGAAARSMPSGCASSSARASPTAAWHADRHAPRRRSAPSATSSTCVPVYKRVDTCAAEFATSTAYLYSTYEEECEAQPDQPAQDHDPGRRPEPHRPGHRVRLLLRARGAGSCARTASRPSWSTAIRRPSPPTTTPPTACTSSR